MKSKRSKIIELYDGNELYRRTEKYIIASEEFNKKYENNYRVDTFLDFSFFNIYITEISSNLSYNLQIMNNFVRDLPIPKIVECYEELKNKIFGDENCE